MRLKIDPSLQSQLEKSKSHAFSCITSLAMYLKKVSLSAQSHARHAKRVASRGLTAHCGIRCRLFDLRGPAGEQELREIRQIAPTSGLYKARRVGELRMSTDSLLPPTPLWPSISSARESSSGQANVNTDR